MWWASGECDHRSKVYCTRTKLHAISLQKNPQWNWKAMRKCRKRRSQSDIIFTFISIRANPFTFASSHSCAFSFSPFSLLLPILKFLRQHISAMTKWTKRDFWMWRQSQTTTTTRAMDQSARTVAADIARTRVVGSMGIIRYARGEWEL